MNLGFTMFFGWLGAVLPDLAQATSFISRFLMYASAVLFPIDRFIDQPVIMAIIEANPLYMILNLYREVLIDGIVPSLSTWLAVTAWAVGALLVGFALFWVDEERYSRE